jgi:hypothetical protein
VLVNVGQAKADLSKLHSIRTSRATGRFLAVRGSLGGRILLADNFESTDAELEDMLDEPT